MYKAKRIEFIEHAAGTWNTQRIGVYRDREFAVGGTDVAEEKLIGEYEYTYSSGLPFAAFEQNGQWYALASRNYTATEILKLPEMEWLGGEKPASAGFCPVELYVPRYRFKRWRWSTKEKDPGIKRDIISDEQGDHEFRFYEVSGWDESTNKYPLRYESFGLVCGCVWGDDSSWKLEMFDLSRVSEGILTRSAPWGYLELPEGMTLKECLRMDAEIDPDGGYVTLDVAERARFAFENGVFRDNREPRTTV